MFWNGNLDNQLTEFSWDHWQNDTNDFWSWTWVWNFDDDLSDAIIQKLSKTYPQVKAVF
jgi:hypothetical protein